MVAGLVSFAGWLLWLARRIFHEDQFPLPGQRVLRPTPLRTGAQARRLAWAAIMAALFLLVLSPLMLYSGFKCSLLPDIKLTFHALFKTIESLQA